MRYEEWEPYYREILDDFGYSEEEDREAADLLAELTRGKRASASEAREILEGEEVVIAGDGPNLAEELNLVGEEDVLVSADGATSTLMLNGLVPDIVVSDLDGDPGRLPEAEERGALINVHAHGDNRELMRAWVPQLGRILPTCQCRPPSGLYNFGGFTDGDRAAFMADELGADSVSLVGFDFSSFEREEKGRKLEWAERLLRLLELDDLG